MGPLVESQNHSHSCRCGKIAEEQVHSAAAEQVQSIGVVAETFAQAQIEWKQKFACTEVQKPEHTVQKPEHTEAQRLEHTEAQKFGHTGAPECIGAEVPVASVDFHCSTYLP